VLLKLGDERLNLREFPNLVTVRGGIHTAEFLATASAFGRHARHDLGALLGWDQFPFVFLVTRLTATLATRLKLG
jgi:hypothetical protein